jgi:plastocyanin domain-containing protein
MRTIGHNQKRPFEKRRIKKLRMRRINQGKKMKFIATYIGLYLIPAITYGQIMESFLIEGNEIQRIRQHAECEKNYSITCMGNSDNPDYFFFHKGRVYAYQDIIDFIDAN